MKHLTDLTEPGIVLSYIFPENVDTYIRYPNEIYHKIEPFEKYLVLMNSKSELFGILDSNALRVLHNKPHHLRIAMNRVPA